MELNLLVNRIDLFFLISLLGFTYYGIYGLVSFNLYMVLFNKARTNILFQNSICPNNFVKGANKCYELVAYGMSSLNALIISIFSIIYITGMYYSYSAIDFENSYQIIYKFSMGYYIADIFYILIVALTTNPLLVSVNTYEDEKLGKKLNESRRLSQQDIFFIIHHLIVIISVFGGVIFDSKIILLMILVLYCIIVYLWQINNDYCILTLESNKICNCDKDEPFNDLLYEFGLKKYNSIPYLIFIINFFIIINKILKN